jgi:hypothetical protein
MELSNNLQINFSFLIKKKNVRNIFLVFFFFYLPCYGTIGIPDSTIKKKYFKIHTTFGYGIAYKLEKFRILSNYLDTIDFKKYNLNNTFNASILAILNKKYLVNNTYEFSAGINNKNLKYKVNYNSYSLDIGYSIIEDEFFVSLKYRYSLLKLSYNNTPDTNLILGNNFKNILPSPLQLCNKFHTLGINFTLLDIYKNNKFNTTINLFFLFSFLNNEWEFYGNNIYPKLKENFNSVNININVVF